MANIGLNKVIDKLVTGVQFKIVFVGDSITSAEWVHPNWRDIVEYVLKEEVTKRLQNKPVPTIYTADEIWKVAEWGIRCFNYGYDGATTRDILAKLDSILEVKPNLVISLMGGNDKLYNITINEHVKNITEITDRIVNSGTELVWCTSTPSFPGLTKSGDYGPFAKATMQIPENTDLHFLDIFTLYKNFPLEQIFTFISEDNPIAGVKAGEIDPDHPNQLGNAYIAKIILGEVFGINFDPERYIQNNLAGMKYPGY